MNSRCAISNACIYMPWWLVNKVLRLDKRFDRVAIIGDFSFRAKAILHSRVKFFFLCRHCLPTSIFIPIQFWAFSWLNRFLFIDTQENARITCSIIIYLCHFHSENKLSSFVFTFWVYGHRAMATLDNFLADHQAQAYTFLINVRGAF